MKLSELLRPELVKVGLEAKDKWSAITQLVEMMVAAGEITQEQQEGVLNAVVERERSMSTGMEKGIAIPHANSSLIEEAVGVLGISKPGIAFEAVDGKPSNVIVLLVIAKDKFQQHVRTLAGIARLFDNDRFMNELCDVNTAEEALEIIKVEEGKSLFYS